MSFPTHLTCPYCPAQAFPAKTSILLEQHVDVMKFQCAVKHSFFVEEEKTVEKELTFGGVPVDLNKALDPQLILLLDRARRHVMNSEEKEAQRQSWVKGEMSIGTDADEAKYRSLLKLKTELDGNK